MIDVSTVTIGADVELPIFDLSGNPFPITGLVGGTKDNPKPMKAKGVEDGFAIQEDNVNLEFNIPPTKTKSQFRQAISTAHILIKKELPPSVYPMAKGSAKYHLEYLSRIPELSRFGCDPDFNAWTRRQNRRPKCDDPTLRSAGGHVHVGWSNPNEEDRELLVRLLDIYLGAMFAPYEDQERRKLYGKAGAFRPKPYGVEYRVLSSIWAEDGAHSYRSFIWDGVQQAIARLNSYPTDTLEKYQELVEKAINEGDGAAIKSLKRTFDARTIQEYY